MRGEHPHQSIATIIPRMVRINHDKLPKQRDMQEAVHHNRVDEQMITSATLTLLFMHKLLIGKVSLPPTPTPADKYFSFFMVTFFVYIFDK